MTFDPGLPPPDKAQVWQTFLWQAVGVPAVVAAGIAVVAAVLWLTGGNLIWQVLSTMSDVVSWSGLIVLLCPLVLILWIADRWTGLRAAHLWATLGPGAQAVSLTTARKTTTKAPHKRPSPRKVCP